MDSAFYVLRVRKNVAHGFILFDRPDAVYGQWGNVSEVLEGQIESLSYRLSVVMERVYNRLMKLTRCGICGFLLGAYHEKRCTCSPREGVMWKRWRSTITQCPTDCLFTVDEQEANHDPVGLQEAD